MMRKIIFTLLLDIFIFLFARPVFAHGSEPRLEINAEILNPGATLQVRGVDFEYEEEAALSLVNATTDVLIISLGTIVTDIEGGFTQNITLPADLPEGVYTIRATTYDHEISSPSITVRGTAILDQEGNGVYDQSDVQLEPLTSLPPDVVPTAASQAIPPAKSVSNQNQTPITISILLAVGILIVFIFRVMRKR